MILALDVHYAEGAATAAGVAFEQWESNSPAFTDVRTRSIDADYVPGALYRRELPALLDVVHALPSPVDRIRVDGYVYLEGRSRPGPGKHLFDALGGKAIVAGIAKTRFAGMGQEFEVDRGGNRRPLFVTCVGDDLPSAKDGVVRMHGEHRLPTMLKLADRLARDA